MAVYLADLDDGTYSQNDPYRLLPNGDITENGEVIDSGGMSHDEKREWVARGNRKAHHAAYMKEYGPR